MNNNENDNNKIETLFPEVESNDSFLNKMPIHYWAYIIPILAIFSVLILPSILKLISFILLSN